jgi:F-type H+-transporting ATPase subunit b
MELLTPNLGLFVWTLVLFLIVLLILRKFAWKPILNALHDREESIDKALKTAEQARAEMELLQSGINQAKADASIERERILKEANEMKNGILASAKTLAQEESVKILKAAKETIEKEKNAAMAEIKNQVAELALNIAEKVIAKKFENQAEQEAVVQEYLKQISLN